MSPSLIQQDHTAANKATFHLHQGQNDGGDRERKPEKETEESEQKGKEAGREGRLLPATTCLLEEGAAMSNGKREEKLELLGRGEEACVSFLNLSEKS